MPYALANKDQEKPIEILVQTRALPMLNKAYGPGKAPEYDLDEIKRI